MMNKTEFNATARILFPSRCFSSSIPELEIREMYPGTNGSTHGERNEINPAMNAAIGRDCIKSLLLGSAEGESGSSLFNPGSSINLDEVLGPFSTGQAQPKRATFLFHSKLDVKKRAAQPFSRSPLGNHGDRLWVGRKLKFVAVRQFSDRLSHRA